MLAKPLLLSRTSPAGSHLTLTFSVVIPDEAKREPGSGSPGDYFFVRKTNGLRAPIPDLRCASSGMTMERES